MTSDDDEGKVDERSKPVSEGEESSDEEDIDDEPVLTRRDAGVFIFGGALGVHLTRLYYDYGGIFSSPPEALPATNRPFIGEEDAPVTIAYWYDYQCPLCRDFEADTLPDIQTEYIDEGVVNIVFKPVIVGGDDSSNTALATHCLWEQVDEDPDLFWDWHQLLVSEYPGDADSGWATPSDIEEFANTFEEVDGGAIRDCVSDEEYSGRIDTDWSEADAWGSQGTPKFVVFADSVEHAQDIEGPQPYPHFASAIDDVLAEKNE